MAEAGAPRTAGAGRRDQYKPTVKREAEAARRRAALAAQQSEARADRVADFRRVALDSLLASAPRAGAEEEDVQVDAEDDDAADDPEGEDVSMGRRGSCKKVQRLRRLQRTLFFARQFQMPDWMVEAPEDLAASWLLMVKPEGDRCLLLSEGGQVMVRRKNGFILERYTDCRLPPGLTILDVVCIEGRKPAAGKAAGGAQRGSDPMPLEEEGAEEEEEEAAEDADEAGDLDVDMGGGGRGGGRGRAAGRGGRRRRPPGDRRYAVMDVLVWGDQDLAGAEAECRMFWLASRFSELREQHPRRARPLTLVPATPASPEALHHAYHSDTGYLKDSLLLLHREGHYSVSEAVTPLALLWRDRQISRFVVDTPDEKGEVLPERQAVVLEVRGGGQLRTADRTVVAQLGEEQLAQVNKLVQIKSLKQKVLIRCEVQGVDLAARQLSGARPVAHVTAKSRVWADSWGRIAFQHLHREGQAAAVSFDVVMKAAAGGAAAPK